MTAKPVSPLRQRMINDMNVRNFVPDTQREYIRAVKNLTIFLKRSPDTATAEELRAFQLHMTETGVRPPTINAMVTALRFFFKVTVDKPETTRHLVFVYEPRKLPRILPPEDVLRLLEAAPNPKSKAALSVAYGAGLRPWRLWRSRSPTSTASACCCASRWARVSWICFRVCTTTSLNRPPMPALVANRWVRVHLNDTRRPAGAVSAKPRERLPPA